MYLRICVYTHTKSESERNRENPRESESLLACVLYCSVCIIVLSFFRRANLLMKKKEIESDSE